MSYTTLRYEVADHILTLTLNRPDQLNAFTVDMAHSIYRQSLLRHAGFLPVVAVTTELGASGESVNSWNF
jgi:1,4-dihydroxy-2-naphthoyl-CoA synthase